MTATQPFPPVPCCNGAPQGSPLFRSAFNGHQSGDRFLARQLVLYRFAISCCTNFNTPVPHTYTHTNTLYLGSDKGESSEIAFERPLTVWIGSHMRTDASSCFFEWLSTFPPAFWAYVCVWKVKAIWTPSNIIRGGGGRWTIGSLAIDWKKSSWWNAWC